MLVIIMRIIQQLFAPSLVGTGFYLAKLIVNWYKINLWCNDLIKGKEKYLIVGISGSIGSASVGKMAPAICLTLYYYIPSPMVIGVFMMMIAGATIWALWK